jgi:hypothetical protein
MISPNLLETPKFCMLFLLAAGKHSSFSMHLPNQRWGSDGQRGVAHAKACEDRVNSHVLSE